MASSFASRSTQLENGADPGAQPADPGAQPANPGAQPARPGAHSAEPGPYSGPPGERAPTGAAAPDGVSGAVAIIGFGTMVLVIVGIVALDELWSLILAVALMLLGVFALSRYVQRIAWTRSSAQRLQEGLHGMNDDFSITDDSHSELSPHDLPLDHPARPQLEEHERREGSRRRHRLENAQRVA